MRKQRLILHASLIIFFLSIYADSFARAGGSFGGGLSFWKIIIFIFLLPIVLIYMLVRAIVLGMKKSKAKSLAQKLETTDAAWNNRSMTARAEEVLMKVQQAWLERNMDLA